MINVLPQNEKSILHKEYMLRLVTICLFIFSSFFFAASFLLMPAYVVSKNKITTLEIELQKYNELNPENSENNLASITSEINHNLGLLNKNVVTKKVTEDIFSTIFSAKPTGVKFFNLLYSVTPEGKNTVLINGQALNRGSLRALEDNLRKDPHVESTNLPVSNFSKRSNIDFSITVFIK